MPSLYTYETTPVYMKSLEAELPKGAAPFPSAKASSQTHPPPLSAHGSLVASPCVCNLLYKIMELIFYSRVK